VPPSEEVRAFVAEQRDGEVDRGLRSLPAGELGEGEVLVRVAWSSVNFKDALATIPKGQVARVSPLVPGIDLAGTVEESDHPDFEAGQEVLAHGYELGVSHHGGFADYARVPAEWTVPLPDGLSARQAMLIGTAGYTAALSVELLEAHGVTPGSGPVLVTGATGGVGSTAVGMLAARGHEVVASSGKPEEADWLRGLGASDVIDRAEISELPERPLGRGRWLGAVDAVGGATLSHILATLRRGGAVAASGNTAGVKLETTVLPFILRGVALVGADSVGTPIERRRELWGRMAPGGDLHPPGLEDALAREVALEDVEPVLDDILHGRMRGRTVVRVGG